MGSTVIIGGTGGLGRYLAERAAGRGEAVVIAGRDAGRAATIAEEISAAAAGPGAEAAGVTGLGIDLARPKTIEGALAGVGAVDHLVITASHQKPNTLDAFDLDDAVTAVTTKLVGYAEVVRVLRGRFTPAASVVLFGGLAKERPYPGSTVVTIHNAGLTGLVKTLAVEIAPHRVNALHPALVGDSPRWREADLGAQAARTPIGRLVTMDEIAGAVDFLLANGGVNGTDLWVDGGFLAQ